MSVRSSILVLTLALALGGCGDSKSAPPDASLPNADAAHADAAPADAAAAPVTLSTGTANVRVYFQNADSSVVLATTTDVTGVAGAVLAPGGFVTAVKPFGREELFTYAGVEPGDHLVIADAAAAPFSYTVHLPVDATPGVTGYAVETREGGASAASPVAPLTLSGTAARTDFLIWTTDAAGHAVSWATVADVAVASGATIDLAAATFAPVQAQTFTVTDLPAGWDQVTALPRVGLPHGPLGITSVALAGSTSTRSGTVLAPTGAPNVRQLDLYSSTNAYLATPSLFDWGAFDANFAIDLAARLLVTQTNVPAWDAVHHQVLWGESASGVAPDLVVMSLAATRASASKTWRWRVVGPHTGAALQLPVLPAGDFDYNVGDAEATFDSLVLAKVPGGYASARAMVFAVAGLEGLIAGSSGAITLERWPAAQ